MKKIIVVMVAVITLMLTGCGDSSVSTETSPIKDIPDVVPQELEGTYNAAFATDGDTEVNLDALGYEDSKIIIQGTQIGIKLGDSEAITTYTVFSTDEEYYTLKVDGTDDMLVIVYYDGTACMGSGDVAIVFRKVV